MVKRFIAPILYLLFPLLSFSQGQYTWTEKASIPAIARHRAVAIAIGNRGYFGTGHYNVGTEVLFSDWWEYDPGTNTWTQKADFGGGPRLHATAFALSGMGYVGTGRDENYVERSDFWQYDPNTNTWVQVADLPGGGRRGAVSFAISKFGYVATGSYYNDLWQYDPSANSWTAKAPMPTGGRESAVGFSIGNMGYVGTGDVFGSTNDFWQYNPNTDQWTQEPNVPGPTRQEACGFVANGEGFIGTGDDYSGGLDYADFYRFNPDSNVWTQITDFAGAARRYMVGFGIGDHAYVGSGTSGINYADFWEYNNNYIDPEPLPSSIEELKKDFSLNISPNPFSESAIVKIQSSYSINHLQFTLYDLNGNQVKNVDITNTEFKLERENLAAGVYIYKSMLDDQIISSGKLIII